MAIFPFLPIIALFAVLTWRVMELENKVNDLRERLDVLDKPCE